MSALQLPAPDAPAEDWGRVAVSLPGWRWMPGMVALGAGRIACMRDGRARIAAAIILCDELGIYVPDPDDPATAGCLEDLSGPHTMTQPAHWAGDGWYRCSILSADGTTLSWGEGSTKGRARIAAAAALGRWPGGEG
jgi:hypothetical protein